MIIDLDAAKTYLEIDITDNSEDDILNVFLQGLDQWVTEICQVELDSTVYTNQLYDGSGDQWLVLKHRPIVSIQRISTDRNNVIKVKNTASDATLAYVSVDSDSIDLTITGGASESSSSLAFTDYTTMTALITAINALGNGWTSSIMDSKYNDLKVTELIQTQAKFCGARANTTASYEYLEMAGEPIAGFEVYATEGKIYYSSGFPSGANSVCISYTAGYSSTTMPYDLKMAILMAIQSMYQKKNEETFNIADFSLGHLRVKYADILPPETLDIINRYKRVILV